MSTFLSLGTNEGNLGANVSKAIADLDRNESIKIVNISSIYQTEPVGCTNQSWFLNLVIEIHFAWTPLELLNLLKKIERTLGRVENYRWGPRIIDIDILSIDDQVIESEQLIIPHCSMHLRNFVLVPLAEIAPYFIHPITKHSVWTMLTNCPEQKVIYHGKA